MHETVQAPPRERRPAATAPLVLRAIRGYEWLFVLLISFLTLFNALGPMPGTTRPPVYLVLGAIFVLIGVALAIWRFRTWKRIRRAVRRPAWLALIAGSALFGYGLITTFFRRGVLISGTGAGRTTETLSQYYQVMPLICGLVTIWMAFLLIMVTPVTNRFALLWRLSVAMVPLSLLGWGRVLLDTTSPRLWTQMGGSAVYPVVLVLCLAVAMAGVARPYRVNQSAWLAAAHLVLLLLTGARSAVVLCVVLVLLLVIRLGRRHTGLGERLARIPRAVFVLGGLAVTVAALSSPLLARLDSKSDGRVMTWRVGRSVLDQDWQRIIFGTGSGSVWPWFASESGNFPLPWRSRMATPWGTSLYHPHSVYVEVLVEFGVIGLVLLALVLYPLLVQWIRGGTVVLVILSSATLACLVSFSVDTYLVKNFPVSLVWWLVLFTTLTTFPHGYPSRPVSGGLAPDLHSSEPPELLFRWPGRRRHDRPSDPPPDAPTGAIAELATSVVTSPAETQR